MKALITGIDGFTGRYLAAELASAGHEVFGLSASSNDRGGKVFTCDICDGPALHAVIARIQPDLVFHLAAIAFVPHGDADTIYRTNIVGTRNLLAALAECANTPKGVLLASSANVYGNATEGVIDERVTPSPANDYAVSKLAMEYMSALWRPQLPITIVRTFNYSGVGQSPEFLLPKIVSHFRRRAPILELGNLDIVRDFSDVRSVVSIYRRLLETTSRECLVNVCSGRGYALREVLEMVGDLAGYMPKLSVNSAFVRSNEVRTLVGSRQLLEKMVGPTAGISLRETLTWMYSAEC